MKSILFLCSFFSCASFVMSQPYVHEVPIPERATSADIIELASQVVPSPNQSAFLSLDFTCFIHIGINTFTGKEWGSGQEDPKLFNPGDTLDTDQWCRVAKAAGMKLMLITVKHHDGLCLWQTRYNQEFSVRATPWRDGKGDVLKDLVASCRKHGLKLGVYLSPADLYQMESAKGLYGNGSKPRATKIPTAVETFLSDPTQVRSDKPKDAPVIAVEADDYNRYFMNQLYELLTEYGSIHEVWFDGAHPKQKGGQTYIKKEWFSLIRQLAPEAVIFGGPDVRWCGNEAGGTREAEWNVLTVSSVEESGVDRPQDDVASDALIVQKEYEVYGKKYPAKSLYYLIPEVNTSIRAGWFWRNEHEQSVRSADDVFDIYERGAGGNGVFLLNVPPNNHGLFSARDVACLEEVGRRIESTYGNRDLMKGAKATEENLLDCDLTTFWQAKEPSCEVEMRLASAKEINRVVVREAVEKVGQRIAEHAVDVWLDGKWQEVAKGKTVGFRKILRFPAVKTERIRLRVMKARMAPALASLEVYHYAAPLPAPLIGRDAAGKVMISLPQTAGFSWKPHGQGDPSNSVRFVYTIDGSVPDARSPRYEQAIDLSQGGLLKACAVLGERMGPIAEQRLGISPFSWKVVECSSEHDATYAAAKAIDGNTQSYWHSSWNEPVTNHPHHLTVDMGLEVTVGGFTYLPRQDRQVPDSMVERGTIEFSKDGKSWSSPIAFHFGNLLNDPSLRTELFSAKQQARYFRFTSNAGAAGKPYAGAAEIGILP
jgi:alpha-L-fucosidase